MTRRVRVAYAGLLALTTCQALRGQPLVSPDAWTLGGLGLIVAGSAVGVGLAVLRASGASHRNMEAMA